MRTYVVWCPDLGQEQEDGATIPATDPADAAEGWAEWHDRSSAEYRIVSGREEIVIVRDVETGEQREWFVRVDGDDIAIASDIRDRNGNHSEANARLSGIPGRRIATAQELLEALEAAMREVGEYEIDWNHPLIAAGEKKLAELNAAAKLPAIGQMSDHTPPPPRSSLTELAEPPVTAVTPQTPQIAVDATLELSIEQTGRLHVGPHTFTAAETTLLGRFLLATRGVWLNLNTRDQHAE